VCLSARISPEPHARSLPFLCILLMAVARSSSGVVAICYVLPVLCMTSCFYNGPYGVMNFATKDRFRSNLLIYRKVGRIQILIIKRHNFDYFEITRKLK